jgi:hypothetical protein
MQVSRRRPYIYVHHLPFARIKMRFSFLKRPLPHPSEDGSQTIKLAFLNFASLASLTQPTETSAANL